MDITTKIEQDIGIDRNYCRVVSELEAVCLVSSKWLKQLFLENNLPQSSNMFGELNVEMRSLLLNDSEVQLEEWKLIAIEIISKEQRMVQRLQKISPKVSSGLTDLRYCQLMHYVTETNYKNLWKQAWHKYCSSDDRRKSRPPELQNYSEVIKEVVKRLFKCPIIPNRDCRSPNPNAAAESSAGEKGVCHSNLVEILCVVESKNSFYIIYEKPKYTLQHCVMFSPAILETSTVRRLFIVYQLLHVIRDIHNSGLCIGSVKLSDIFVEQNLWVRLFPRSFRELCDCSTMEEEKLGKDMQSSVCEFPRKIGTNTEKHFSKPGNSLESATELWIKGALSNYDYLMELNKFAGRVKDNPHCHPVMPWIMNFSVPEGGWRDLTKSKFRLNKGDKQLDLTYESAALSGSNIHHGTITSVLQNSAVMVPHHMSDVLTDITYYVYKARRLPKAILCQHVRQHWVPAEYPSTVERLQEWTPDECIPEFFSDPSVFYSIHDDLPDLGVPSWSESPEDFIKKHRAALESDHVSERLHHWIDLTFGYKLTGNAAVKFKNVCLPLVDQHTSVCSHGMVQLFNHPHPHKLSSSLYYCSIAPKTFRNVVNKLHDAKDSGEEETSSDGSIKAGRWKVLRSKSMPAGSEQLRSETRPENLTIILPKDYNPLAALRQLESFHAFVARTQGGRLPQERNQADAANFCDLHNQNRDMFVLGCLISEMSLSSHLKFMGRDASLEERFSVVLKLLKIHKHEVPRCFWQVLQLLLQLTPSFESEPTVVKSKRSGLPSRYPPVSIWGLPPPSPHQLLQPLIHIIPFPPYFSELYTFLQHLDKFSSQLKSTLNDNTSNSDPADDVAKSMVQFAADKLRVLLPKLSAEAVELLIPYLQNFFENSYTSLHASWYLFGTVSQCLGPQQSVRKLLKMLIKVFDPDVPSSKHMKLYHRRFLLQLIVRLGLQNFLAHFMTILIEAVGGMKDFSPTEKDGEEESCAADGTVRRKSSHLQSPELQEMAEETKRQLTGAIIAAKSSNFDDDSSHGNLQFIEADDEKDAEMFDFDENSEDSIKAAKDVGSIATPTKDGERFDEDVSVQADRVDMSNIPQIPENEDDDDDEEEEPDVIDALASPVTESRRSAKPSLYSQSAPALTSPIADYKDGQDHSDGTNEMRKEGSPEVATDALNSVLSPSSSKGDGNLNISDVAAESILWLTHRLGPVLTARYVTRNLLRMLTLCYEGPEKREVIIHDGDKFSLSISHKWYSGDVYALKVLDCLSRVAALYGEQFIMLQYFPYIADLLTLCKKRITPTLESGLIGAMSLLQHIIPYLSDATLMDDLQDIIVKDILYVAIRLISSLRLMYPGGGNARFMITCRLIDVIYIIGVRIGFEMTRKHLSSILQKFFSCFDKVYNQNAEFRKFPEVCDNSSVGTTPVKESALEEMKRTFTPEIAYLSYIPFCKLAGDIFMEHTLKNDELIRNLCLKHDLDMARIAPGRSGDHLRSKISTEKPFVKSHHREASLGQDDSFVSGVFGKNVSVVGNRLDVQLGEESHLVAAMEIPLPNYSSKGADVQKYDIGLLRRKMDNSHRHLKGNWLAYWEHEKGRSEKDDRFNFKQIKLQSFIGHTGAVRVIQVLDNENSFLTSSKDKTVKLWSLRSYGDGSAQTPCQWTYNRHRKSVFAVSFLDSLRLVGSCDSTVHIWDPFMGSCIKQIEPTKGSPITVLTAMPAPSSTFLAATTNSTVRFLDARTCRYMHEFKVSIGSTGLIRCLAVSPNSHWIAIGHSTGMISVLDVRTGLLFSAWMGHEGEILQLKAYDNSHFVTSSLDHYVSVWNSDTSQMKCHLKGPLEPVTNICFYKGEMISATAGNKIGVHTAIDKKANYTSTRLRSDTFKGMMTTMALLPLNRLLMLGADNGNLVLLS